MFGKKTVLFLTFYNMFKVFCSLFASLPLPDRCSALKLRPLLLLTCQAAPVCRSNCFGLMLRVLNNLDSVNSLVRMCEQRQAGLDPRFLLTIYGRLSNSLLPSPS